MGKTVFTIDKDNLEVHAERVYKATPEQLYDAYTDPEKIAQWWGPAKYKMIVDKMDVRVGGVWRFLHEEADGTQYAFNGVYKELDRPNKIVDSFEFEGMPGHVLIETATFEPQPDGTTKLTATSRYENLEDLEGMVATGMEGGLTEGQERLARLVEQQ
jgi:uncharacterized protein YndB with AHSA1/START domain